MVRVREILVEVDGVVREEEREYARNFEVGWVVREFGTARPQRSNHPGNEVK